MRFIRPATSPTGARGHGVAMRWPSTGEYSNSQRVDGVIEPLATRTWYCLPSSQAHRTGQNQEPSRSGSVLRYEGQLPDAPAYRVPALVRCPERKTPWEDHKQYLVGLKGILAASSGRSLIALGDFNQTIESGGHVPPEVRSALRIAFSQNVTIPTSALAFQGRRSIDHISLSPDLNIGALDVICNVHEGRRLSDHFGVVAELSAG